MPAAADAAETRVILVVGTVTLGLAAIAALAAFTARETSRIHMNDLGKKDAVPVPKTNTSECGPRQRPLCPNSAAAAAGSARADADKELR
jgi:hypothetical protein